MRLRNHAIYCLICVSIWIMFGLVGLLNNHYQAWSLDWQIIHCIDLVLLTWPLTYVVLRKITNQKYIMHSLWFAFYGSVPFIILDYLYLHFIKGFNLSYLFSYWYLTIFYIIPWIEMPLIGYYLEKRKISSEQSALP
jgi:hypothetical protein